MEGLQDPRSYLPIDVPCEWIRNRAAYARLKRIYEVDNTNNI